MGMFDEVTCLVPVDGEDISALTFQSKSLSCGFDHYEIRPDGLYCEDYGPDGRRNGQWTRVEHITDAVHFGGSPFIGTPDCDFVALFRKGALLSVDRIPSDEA